MLVPSMRQDCTATCLAVVPALVLLRDGAAVADDVVGRIVRRVVVRVRIEIIAIPEFVEGPQYRPEISLVVQHLMQQVIPSQYWQLAEEDGTEDVVLRKTAIGQSWQQEEQQGWAERTCEGRTAALQIVVGLRTTVRHEQEHPVLVANVRGMQQERR